MTSDEDGPLREHHVVLAEGAVTLRPMGESDWAELLALNNDPVVLWTAEGDDVDHWPLADLQHVYRSISRRAFMFVIEHEGDFAGECWLQEMNLAAVLDRHPGQDCRRIDLALRPDKWNQSIGTSAIRLLTRFAFEQQTADLVFACDVWGFNEGSLRAFAHAGYQPWRRTFHPAADKGPVSVTLVCRPTSLRPRPRHRRSSR